MEKKFELGPLQKLWIKTLREHPERQCKESLGEVWDRGIKACCLGQYLLCYREQNNIEIPLGRITDKDFRGVLGGSWGILGLNSERGTIYGSIEAHTSLVVMNDRYSTWPEIADFIEANPEKVFTKSV